MRTDFLRALEQDPPDELVEQVCKRPHNVWETAVWAAISGRLLVRRSDGTHRLLPPAEVAPSDPRIPGRLEPCELTVRDDGQFQFTLTDHPTRTRIYARSDPVLQERAFREALPALYRSFCLAVPTGETRPVCPIHVNWT